MKKLFFLFFASIMITACTKDDPGGDPGIYDNGVFVVNEGPFGTGTGTLTFIGDDGNLTQKVFEKENGNVVLGNIAQSMIWHNNRYYIVVNNANKIVVADKDMKVVGEITGLTGPRFMVAQGNKAYISEWGENYEKGGVAIADLTSLKVVKQIPTGKGPEALLLDGNQLLVPNGGSYNASTFETLPDSTISVIDIGSESVTKVISVKYNPNSIIKAGNGYLVASAEKSFGTNNGSIYFIRSSDNSVTKVAGATTGSYAKLHKVDETKSVVISGFAEALLLTFDAAAVSMTQKTLDFAYSVDYDIKRKLIYIADAGDFSSEGKVITYNVNGTKEKEFAAGIIPGNFCFR